ncbi:hypothetical protein Esi_0009_0019 [Ectocarpus siliculosus]|uniref:Uncharacterized protein n=1 Tax=Ectocarpus siliculosus TaxID=2880 RepID=D8LTL1_ECTSI|nr:hypothetical protein Esi_0009_0019 [Ectocarpus siliculosus]|eukprot:CBN73908.1 hypothetical protein Esi_0009_0019 [Ectocarpus siliculosus]
MSAADLAAKKMLLPFINELSFIEIALAARGNPSGGGLASSNPIAKDAINLFQSSYLFTEGLSSLGKATGTIPRNPSPRRSPRKVLQPHAPDSFALYEARSAVVTLSRYLLLNIAIVE